MKDTPTTGNHRCCFLATVVGVFIIYLIDKAGGE